MPRGELFAFLLLTKHSIAGGVLDYVTDNQPSAETHAKGPNSARNTSNCDLWDEVYQHVNDKSLTLRVRWMPSHLAEGKKVRPASVTDHDIVANDKADELASTAAELVQLPTPFAVNHVHYVQLARNIQKRLASILMHLPNRTKQKEVKHIPIKPPSIPELIASSRHTISLSGNRYSCSECRNNFRSQDPGLKAWLQLPCDISHNRDLHKPTKVNIPIHIGNNTAHSTHDLYQYRGVTYCNTCGGFGIEHFSLLAKECQAPKTAGLRLLRCIARGQMPTGVTQWPD